MSKIDYRKYRKSKIFMHNREMKVNTLLDTGARYSYISFDIALEMGLPNLGDFETIHSDKIVEKDSWYSTIFLSIRGKDFPVNVVVSKKIGKRILIIGADFMEQYKMVLRFDVKEGDIELIKYNNKISWERDL